jgi:rod shape-determining protein MreD
MKNIFFALFLVLVAVAQATLLDYARIFSVKPDLLLITAVWGSLFFKFNWAFACALLAGILKDAFSVYPFGINTLLFPLWAALGSYLSRKIAIETNYRYAALAGAAAFAQSAVTAVILPFVASPVSLGIFLRILIFGSLYAAVAAFFWFGLLEALFRQKR